MHTKPQRVGHPGASCAVGGTHSWLFWWVCNTWFLEMQASVIWLIHGTWASRVSRLLHATRAWFGESATLLLLSLQQCNNAVAWQLLKHGSRPVRVACSLPVHSSRCCRMVRGCRELLHTLFILWESYFGPWLSSRGEKAGAGCSVPIFTQLSHMSFSMVSPHSIVLYSSISNSLTKELLCFLFLLSCVVGANRASTFSQPFWSEIHLFFQRTQRRIVLADSQTCHNRRKESWEKSLWAGTLLKGLCLKDSVLQGRVWEH